MKFFIISSKDFQDKLPTIKFNLQKLKHIVALPTFELGRIPNYINKKEEFLKKDINKIKDCQAILVCNFSKKNIENYIGSTLLIYMAVAFCLDKKIFILYDIPNSENKEEIIGLNPICLEGDLKKIRNYI
jgi:hypothetical protein